MEAKLLTKEETVTGEAEIWAIPNKNPEVNGPGAFYYEVTQGPWQSGAIKIHTFEVNGTVPAGINLIEAALATIEEKKAEINERAYREVQTLEKEAEKLLLLTNQQNAYEGNVYESEAIDAEVE